MYCSPLRLRRKTRGTNRMPRGRRTSRCVDLRRFRMRVRRRIRWCVMAVRRKAIHRRNVRSQSVMLVMGWGICRGIVRSRGRGRRGSRWGIVGRGMMRRRGGREGFRCLLYGGVCLLWRVRTVGSFGVWILSSRVNNISCQGLND